MNEFIKKSEAVDVIVKYPYEIAGKTATAIKMIEDLPSADVVPKSELEISQHLLKEAWERIEELGNLCGELQRKYDMAERKFADEEVIKALEWCIQNGDCADCEYREKTDKSDICPIRMDALNLINRQNAEIERWKKYNTDVAFKHYNDGKTELVSEIFEEIERIILDNTYPDFNREHKPVNIWKAKDGYDAFYELKKKYTEGEE